MDRNGKTKLARRLTMSPHQMGQKTRGRPLAAEAMRWRMAVRTGRVDLFDHAQVPNRCDCGASSESERQPLPVQFLEAERSIQRGRGLLRRHHLELDRVHAAPARLLHDAREQRTRNAGSARFWDHLQLSAVSRSASPAARMTRPRFMR